MISLELIIYLALILAALVMRLPNLDVVSLTDREAHEALAAFRAIEPPASGTVPIANNPLMFAANMLVMSIGGAENGSARVATALLGVLIVGLPLCFRRWLGPANALIISGLLALSPVLLTASRSMSGSVWSLALVMGALWCIGKFAESRRAPYALAAGVMLVLLALAAEPAGFLMLLGLGVGVLFASAASDENGEKIRQAIAEIRQAWPWLTGLIVAVLALIASGTAFLTYPRGLESVGAAVNTGLQGLSTRPAGYPGAFPLLVSLVYEPLFWIFGLIGLYFVLSGQTAQNPARLFIDRVYIGWLVASVVWSLVYPGAEASHALWLTLPLVGLSATAIEKALAPVHDPFWQVPAWGPWLHGVAVVAIVGIAGINLLAVSRAVAELPLSVTPALDQRGLMNLLMVVLALALAIITFFLVGSMWGARGSWHGLAIGLLIALSLYTFRVGWRVAVTGGDDARELWHARPAALNVSLMEDTLRTASMRATGKPYTMDITVQLPAGMGEDGALAWSLRRFTKTTYVDALSGALNASVVIAPKSDQPPQLGGAYVGEAFPIYYVWNPASLADWDFLPWLYDRQTRLAPQPNGQVIVWVRSDIYGLSLDTPGGTLK
jgi:hypothetical protein